MNGQARQIQIHGGDIYRNRNVTDYSVNSNPLGPPDAVLEALHEHARDIVHYPDVCCQELKEAIGRFEGYRPARSSAATGLRNYFCGGAGRSSEKGAGLRAILCRICPGACGIRRGYPVL